MCAGLTVLGHDVEAMLALARIQPSVLEESDGRIPHSSMIGFWESAEEQTGDRDIGIHVAEAAPTDAFTVHAYAVLSSPNIQIAFVFDNRQDLATSLSVRTPVGDKKLEGSYKVSEISRVAEELYEGSTAPEPVEE